jgi:GalNAc5-diNAcBac-PP-undecaprenol beta-1,3-glucosyltransferase
LGVILRAALIVPTFDHATTLGWSVRSALHQTVEEIEVHIVGDGVTADVRDTVSDLLRQDERVRFHDHPKGPRRGEAYRNPIVRSLDAALVGYLADDDVLFPEHLEVMEEVLASADVSHPPQLYARVQQDSLLYWPVDVSDRTYLYSLLAGGPGRVYNRLSLTGTTHTKAAYLRLPYGWRTTPEGMATDVYMWLQFLEQDWCRAVTAPVATRIVLPSEPRRTLTADERGAETQRWFEAVTDPQQRPRVDALVTAAYQRAALDADRLLRHVERTRWWRTRQLATRGVRRFTAR